MPIACPGCERIFSATKNLKTHQKKCQKYDQYLMNIVSQKHALEDDIESSYASAKRARVTASGSADGNVNAASDLFLVSSLMLCAMRPPHGICTQHEEEPGPSSFAPNPPSPSPVPDTSRSRSGRTIRFPCHRYEDFLPAIPTPLVHIPSACRTNVPIDPEVIQGNLVTSPAASLHDANVASDESGPFDTPPNAMGVFRRYPRLPTLDPERNTSLQTLCEGSAFDTRAVSLSDSVLPVVDPMEGADPWVPFTNYSSALMMAWHYSGSTTKTAAETDRLAQSICNDENFRPSELKNFSVDRENDRVDSFIKESSTTFQRQHGWHESSVKIRLPCSKEKFPSGEQDAPEYTVDGVHHRRIVDVIRGKAQFNLKNMFSFATLGVFSDNVDSFHMAPFESYWMPDPDDPDVVERLHGEIYQSDAMLEAQDQISKLPRAPDDSLERVVAPLMVWSDSTQLANFGSASLWPFYLYFGNQSKYARGKPTANVCHHLAYIPTVSPNLLNPLAFLIYSYI